MLWTETDRNRRIWFSSVDVSMGKKPDFFRSLSLEFQMYTSIPNVLWCQAFVQPLLLCRNDLLRFNANWSIELAAIDMARLITFILWYWFGFGFYWMCIVFSVHSHNLVDFVVVLRIPPSPHRLTIASRFIAFHFFGNSSDFQWKFNERNESWHKNRIWVVAFDFDDKKHVMAWNLII